MSNWPTPPDLDAIALGGGDLEVRLVVEVRRLQMEVDARDKKLAEIRVDLDRTADSLRIVRADNDKLEAQGFELIVERDNLKKMLADANSREEAQIGLINEFRRRWPFVVAEFEKPVPMCAQPEVTGTFTPLHCAKCKHPTMTMVDECDTCKRTKPDPLHDIMPAPGSPPVEGRSS